MRQKIFNPCGATFFMARAAGMTCAVLAAGFLSACRSDPVPIGIGPAAKTSRVDEGIASEIAQSRQLCAMHGDANCKELIDDEAARNDPDYGSWWDPIWTGNFKEIPESQGSQRH